MSILTRIRNAWAAFWADAKTIEHRFTTGAEADLLQIHARVTFALRYLKDLPMALSDDIAAIGAAITNALNAKQAEVAPLQQQVTDLTAQNAALTDQINQASAQLQALTANLTQPTA